jgi:hypothetical protein
MNLIDTVLTVLIAMNLIFDIFLFFENFYDSH